MTFNNNELHIILFALEMRIEELEEQLLFFDDEDIETELYEAISLYQDIKEFLSYGN